MDPSALSIIPPLITIAVVFWTRDIKASLVVGIATAALMATSFAPLAALKLTGKHILEITELTNFLSWKAFLASERLFLFLFLLILGMIMALMEHSGDAFAYAEYLKGKLRGQKTAQKATLLFSLSLFIDDYLNSITTSSVMPFLTDVFKIPRIKVAFLILSLAAPLCTLIPISSWGPPITMFIGNGGVHPTDAAAAVAGEAFYVLLKSVPFIIQSVLAIFSSWFIITMGISYGTIGKHERIAKQTGNIYGGRKKQKIESSDHPNSHSLFSFLSPLIILIGGIAIAALYSGDFWLFGGEKGMAAALASANMYGALLSSALVTVVYTTSLHIFGGRNSFQKFISIYWSGIKEMGQSVVVLVLALSFAEFLIKDLYTGKYIAHALMPFMRIEFLPVATFLLSALTAFSMGSSWATMTIMFPIVIPMLTELTGIATPAAVSSIPLLYPLIGAVIAGAVAGSSMSPIADLLIIISGNSGINHFDFVKAQIQYLSPLAIGSTLGFLVAGFSSTLGYKSMLSLSLMMAFVIAFSLLMLFNATNKRAVQSTCEDTTL